LDFKDKKIIGISCFYHDSAAALVNNGEIVCAVQEERFTRIKHDSSFPKEAIKFCLESENITFNDIDSIVYYEKPLLTFERLLETYISTAPRGIRSFIAAMQIWLKKKLFLKTEIKKQCLEIQNSISTNNFDKKDLPEILFSEHHLSHAASAFYPSPFKNAAILCMDGVGEWATTSVWRGNGKDIDLLWQIDFPHSLGLLYSAFTYYCGFKVNSGEYKLMGLAPYGKSIYVEKIKKYLIDIKSDGTFHLNMKYFKFHRGFRMTSSKFDKLFGNPPRKPETELTQFHMDIAASIQAVIEDVIILLAQSIKNETGEKNLCLSGGVALNCVANGKLLKTKIFENIWIQPASGDAGNAIGAGLAVWHKHFNNKRKVSLSDSMKGSYLGPSFTNTYIKKFLINQKAKFKKFDDNDLFKLTADLLDKGKVIGWFSGKMEFGPRALGARSIIGDPRNVKMQSIMNLKIKYRESFRPFAPAVLEEEISNYFECEKKSPYMLLVSEVKKNLCIKMGKEHDKLFGIDKLNLIRSTLPAITHVDYSARIQTVSLKTNPRFYNLIKAFKKKTSIPVLVNTSFNVRGEPIVCTPKDAYLCFMRTEMDVLILQNYILYKEDQTKLENDVEWEKTFQLD
tara:strand:- start:2448 stop:4319 length:1872 start_codon:yes stop_codon:yes gene_type:complete